jgi:hypothetical protein
MRLIGTGKSKEKLYYPWLAFTPSDNAKWRQIAQTWIQEGNYRMLQMLREIHPKEFEMIEISEERWRELREQLSPARRKNLMKTDYLLLDQYLKTFPKISLSW